jgi:formylglycine-generating enzyme required for sulfatase activity
MKRPYLFWLVIALLSLAGNESHAYLAGGEIGLKIEVFLYSPDAAPELLCARETSFETNRNHAWHFAARVESPDEALPETKEDFAECALPRLLVATESENPNEPVAGNPNLFSVDAFIVRQMEDERLLSVRWNQEPDSALQYVTRSADPGEPDVFRRFDFAEDAVVYVPMALGAPGGEAEPTPAVLVRMETALLLPERTARFGKITVVGPPNAVLLLDGGEIGQVPESGQLTLSVVEPGARRLDLKTEDGAINRRWVNVKPGRTSYLDFLQDKDSSEQFAIAYTDENEWGYREFVRERDGALLVEIPEGEFLMGNKDAERTPFEHTVWLSTFLIDKTAVTWAQYRKYLSDTGLPLPPHDAYWGMPDDHPAVYVSWVEARGYCQWAGARLPTEAEREKAARGTDGRMYAWGEEPPTPELGVFRRQWGSEATDPVGIRTEAASPYGVMDMSGNVWEWCEDWYSDEYLESSPRQNPPGPVDGTRHVLRGGSWDSRPDVLSVSVRNWGHPGYREGDFGFRCAMNAPPD